MTQLDYNLYMPEKHIGMIADGRQHLIETNAAEGAIKYGFGVIAGTDPAKQVKLPLLTGGVFRGITISTWAKEQVSGDGLYADTDAVNTLRRGVVWVEVNSDVVIDEAAYFVYAGADAGKFRNDATSADAVPTGIFRSSALSGELAKLEINLP